MQLYNVSVGAEMGSDEAGAVSLSHHSQSGWGFDVGRGSFSYRSGVEGSDFPLNA